MLGGRHACPLKDVKYDQKAVDDTHTDVTVTFTMPTCIVPGVLPETLYSVTFQVESFAEEFFIKDIVRHIEGENLSLVDEMNSMTVADEVATQEQVGLANCRKQLPNGLWQRSRLWHIGWAQSQQRIVMAGTNSELELITEGPVIILVEPQMGENIGMVARAMANFGLAELGWFPP